MKKMKRAALPFGGVIAAPMPLEREPVVPLAEESFDNVDIPGRLLSSTEEGIRAQGRNKKRSGRMISNKRLKRRVTKEGCKGWKRFALRTVQMHKSAGQIDITQDDSMMKIESSREKTIDDLYFHLTFVRPIGRVAP